MTVRVLLVEDSLDERERLRAAFTDRGGYAVVGEIGDGVSATDAARRLQPDVVVLALGLRDLASRDVLARIRRASPWSQVVVRAGVADAEERHLLATSVDGAANTADGAAYLVDLVVRLCRRHYAARSISLGARVGEVRRARQFVRELLEHWGDLEVHDAALTVVSELVANAIVHARTASELRVVRVEGVVRLELTDFGRGTPAPRVVTPTHVHGRGLLLVSALASAWGMHALAGGGKVVWAELALAAQGAEQLAAAER